MYEEQAKTASTLLGRLEEDLQSLRINEFRQKLADLKLRQSDPEIYNQFDRLKAINIEVKKTETVVAPWDQIKTKLEDLSVFIEISEEEKDPAAKIEIAKSLDGALATLKELELRRFFQESYDSGNTYLSIQSGAGGTESCDWALMLYRMYSRWIESKGFTCTIMDYQEGDEAGVKSVSLLVEGAYAHGFLACEAGVHRLVRISPFDSNARRHTSFVAVYATPEVEDDVEVTLNWSDVRVDTYRSSGAGGQHVNKTDSAVRLTHGPTGIVVACQAERSQVQNREKAIKMLKAKLYERALEDRKAALDSKAIAKKKIEWGSQIRSYVLQPYTLVKDHRTDFETSNVNAVLDGDIEGFIEAYLRSGSTVPLASSVIPE